MKKCKYCGGEYADNVVVCPVDQTPLETQKPPPLPEAETPEFLFVPLSEAERQSDLVTLVKCRTLVAADMIACELRASGIEVFLPDEYLMQAVGWNFNTYGYVRVQVPTKDYETAKVLLTETV